MFNVEGLSKSFGRMKALQEVTFSVATGEILGVAGPNGAGKTTLINSCTGHLRASAKKMTLDGRDLLGLTADQFCKAGVARTFQIPQIFSSMTVAENIEIGAMFGGSRDGYSKAVDRFLEYFRLTQYSDRPSASTDLITRKSIMLAAAMATHPSIVFLDEPLAGLNDAEVDYFTGLIARVRDDFRVSLVVVEHKVRALSNLADSVMILEFGKIIRTGSPDEVFNDPTIQSIYHGRFLNA